ncbi:MAG: arsenate reductase ArsC [candidate division WOR-3 bacterium]
MKKKVLFICTHNSARSQMAEAFLRHLYPDKFEVYSAGTKPGSLNPIVVRVMEEIGIDMSSHYSKGIDGFVGMEFDYVVTVCDSAKESCPFFPGAKQYIHKSFPDPSNIPGSEEEKLEKIRGIRDSIREFIEEFFGKE